MRLIKIDVIRLQSPQRIFDRAQNISLRQAFHLRPHLQPNFCGNDDFVASATLLEPLADDRFRFTTTIARRKSGISVSRVDEIKSGGDESIEQPEGRCSSTVQPKTFPPNASGATSNPELPKLRLLIFLRGRGVRIARVSLLKRRRTWVWMDFSHAKARAATKAALP